MNLSDYYRGELQAHQRIAEAMAAVEEDFVALAALATDCLQNRGKILLFGNGGSAADAQHIAAELTGRYVDDRPALAAIALTTDSSALTAIGNDYGFEHLFARQIEALGQAGDLAIGISTSGNSANVIAGLGKARTLGLKAAGFAGRDGGAMVGLADPLLIVPDMATPRIQEMHILLGHMLCGAVERQLGLITSGE